MSRTIGVLSGSFRAHSNGAGIAEWVAGRLRALTDDKVLVLDSKTAPLPLGPIVDGPIAAAVTSPSGYASPAVQTWSRLVWSLSALVVVSPQYNWSLPGELKNSIDHIYNEWKGLPVAIFTYGGHGGGKAGAALKTLFEGGVHSQVVSAGEVEISLPKDFIVGTPRVGKVETPWLEEYAAKVDESLKKVAEAAGKVERVTPS